MSKLDSRLVATLSYFCSPEAHAMVNWSPSLRWDSDSWYYVTALVDLVRLARGDDSTARQLLRNSVERAIDVARRYNCLFPILFDPVGDMHPVQPPLHPPHEYDVASAYVYLMLDLYEETGEARYLQEAQAAVEALCGRGFDLAYELHVTALAAAACARLFRLASERSYVRPQRRFHLRRDPRGRWYGQDILGRGRYSDVRWHGADKRPGRSMPEKNKTGPLTLGSIIWFHNTNSRRYFVRNSSTSTTSRQSDPDRCTLSTTGELGL